MHLLYRLLLLGAPLLGLSACDDAAEAEKFQFSDSSTLRISTPEGEVQLKNDTLRVSGPAGSDTVTLELNTDETIRNKQEKKQITIGDGNGSIEVEKKGKEVNIRMNKSTNR
ncbi:MAG TPA: hypothetical protein PKE07_08675 [Lacibacter sp.]|nr:hypothetical protein [Lacibacter sp.]HMO90078.1 hypothetical protein [Lacibacter sp.]